MGKEAYWTVVALLSGGVTQRSSRLRPRGGVQQQQQQQRCAMRREIKHKPAACIQVRLVCFSVRREHSSTHFTPDGTADTASKLGDTRFNLQTHSVHTKNPPPPRSQIVTPTKRATASLHHGNPHHLTVFSVRGGFQPWDVRRCSIVFDDLAQPRHKGWQSILTPHYIFIFELHLPQV